MRVLVTGASGFTGRYLVPRLIARGHEAVPCDADLTDDAALDRAVGAAVPDAVVHLAGNSFAASDAVTQYYNVNTLGTIRLLNAIASLRATRRVRVLVASTAGVYRSDTSGTLSEGMSEAPGNHYANSKWTMERAVATWRESLDITVVRPFNYTGVGQDLKFLVPKIVKHFRSRAASITLGNLDVVRDFGDVRDVVDAYIGLLDIPNLLTGPVNICTGMGTTVREILTMAEAITNHRVAVGINAEFVRFGEPKFLLGDNARLKSLLPTWSSRPFEQTVSWMLSSDAEREGPA